MCCLPEGFLEVLSAEDRFQTHGRAPLGTVVATIKLFEEWIDVHSFHLFWCGLGVIDDEGE